MNFIPGNSYRLSPNQGGSHTRMCTGHSAAHGFIQTRSPSPSGSVSKDAGPHGFSVFGTSVGPASHAAPSVLTVVSYINRHGLSSRRLFILAKRLLRWAQLNLRSLKATHVPGKLNLGADMQSRNNVPSDEWTLHPQMVKEIWRIFGRPEINLFASEDNNYCQTYF